MRMSSSFSRIAPLALLLLALLAAPADARSRRPPKPEPGPELRLATVLQLAAAHPSLLPLGRAVAEAEARATDAARRAPDSAGLEVENFGGKAGSEAAETTFSYSRPLLDRRRVSAKRAQGEAEILAARLALAAARRRVSNECQAAFHALVATDRLVAASREAGAVAGEMTAAVAARFAAGAATENDRLRAEVERTRVDAVTRRYEGEAATARASLALALGRPDCPPGRPAAELSADLSLPPTAELEAAAFATHPDLLALAQEETERSALEKTLSAERRRETRLTGGVRAYRAEARNDHAFVAAVETDLPRPDANAGALAAVRMAEGKLQLKQTALVAELSARLREAVARFEASRALARDFRDKLAPRAKRLLDATLEAYAAGKADLIAVLEARRAHAESRLEHLEALRDMIAAADAVETISGVCVSKEVHP